MFDDKAAFNDWFGEALGGEDGGGADWLQEKRVVVIHRLHQILEPFMLRRQVQDVEGSLPEKVRGWLFLQQETQTKSLPFGLDSVIFGVSYRLDSDIRP